jgi:hypothetical protein
MLLEILEAELACFKRFDGPTAVWCSVLFSLLEPLLVRIKPFQRAEGQSGS